MYRLKVRPVGVASCLMTLLVIACIGLRSASSRVDAADTSTPKIKSLLKEKLAVLQEVETQAMQAYQSGEVSFARPLQASQAVGKARLELCDGDGERVAVLEKMLEGAKEYERAASENVKSGESPSYTVLEAKANRLEIEIALERIKSK